MSFKKLKNKLNENFLFIELVLTYKCNYNCSYCYQKEERLNKEEIKFGLKDLNILKKLLLEYKKFLQKNNVKDSLIYFEVIGGEVTYIFESNYLINLKRKIEKILKNLKFESNRYIFNITTNFSKEINYYQRLLNNGFYLSISYHKEFNNFEKFINKIKKLDKNFYGKINFTINYFTNEEYNFYKNKIEEIDLDWEITFNKINQYLNNENLMNPIKCYAKYFVFENGLRNFCKNEKIDKINRGIFNPIQCFKKVCYCPNHFKKEIDEKIAFLQT